MFLQILCFLECYSIIKMNEGSLLSIMHFNGEGIYFSVFPICLSRSLWPCWLMSPVRESNTWSVATWDGSPGHLWHKIMLWRRKFPRNVFFGSGECGEENILTVTGMKGIGLCIVMHKCTRCSCYRPGSSRFLPTNHGYTSRFDFPVLIAFQCSFLSGSSFS